MLNHTKYKKQNNENVTHNKWHAIKQFEPGGAQAALFISKLQQQTGWDQKFCTQAIDEYKRFVYLATVSKTAISPSAIVDEVWHLHLTFSRCYWERLCRELLECPLHHEPAVPSDRAATDQQYLDTLNLYRANFDQEAPEAFWPTPASSEQKAHKSLIYRPGRIFPTVAILLASFMAAVAVASNDQATSSSNIFPWFIGAGAVVLFIFLLSKIKQSKGGNSTSCGGVMGGGSNNSGSDNDSSCGSSCGGCGGCGG